MDRQAKARILLLGSGMLWGTFPVIMRRLYSLPGPTLAPVFITAVRYGLMAIIVVTFMLVRRPTSRGIDIPAMMNAAAEIGTIGEFANILSTMGLSGVPAVLAETLLGTVHVFVPLQTWILIGSDRLGARTVVACCLSFCAVLTGAAMGEQTALSGNAIPKWSLLVLVAAAWCYGLMRVRIEHHLRRGHDAFALAGARIVAMGLLGLLLVGIDVLSGGASAGTLGNVSRITTAQWAWLAVSCLLSGLGGSLLHFQAQALVPAANAQPFFALTPVYAAGWTWLILDEPLPPTLLVSACVMIAGALLAASEGRAARLERGAVSKSGASDGLPAGSLLPRSTVAFHEDHASSSAGKVHAV